MCIQLALSVLIGGLASVYDVWRSGGGCGWDGTCSDAGVLPLTFLAFLVLLASDVIIATAAACAAWRRVSLPASWDLHWDDEDWNQRHERHADEDPATTFGALWATRLSVTTMLVCLACLALLGQGALITHVAGHLYGTSVTSQAAKAGFELTWSTGLPVAEIALGVLAWLAAQRLRRRRRARHAPAA